MSNAIRIYRHALSGHAHRVELFASLAGISTELVDVDLAAGAQNETAFRDINPFGQVPTIQDGDLVLSDSNAILIYLAKTYAPEWYPEDTITQAEIQRFLSMAAGEIAYGPATARLKTVFGAPIDADRAKSISDWAFERLENHLNGREWLVGNRATLADIAIYSYTAHAPEGNVSLESYPNIKKLLARIEALPGFIHMQASSVGLAA